MLMKTIGIGAIVIALALGAHATGLINLKAETARLNPFGTRGNSIVVGVDITEGREKEVPKDLKAIQVILAHTNPGDRVEVFLIHSRSESAQEALFEVQMPEDEGPVGLSLQRAQKAAQSRLKERWRETIGLSLADAHLVRQTDLFGFLRFVSQKREFMCSKRPLLILLTDGQEVGDGFNFERKAPDREDLLKVRKEGLMADLRGISVFMLGCTATHNISNAHWRNLQGWWRAYLKEAGAEVKAITSERGTEGGMF